MLVTLVGGLALPGLVLALVGLVRFLAGYRPRPRALRIAGAVLLASALSALVDIALSVVAVRYRAATVLDAKGSQVAADSKDWQHRN